MGYKDITPVFIGGCQRSGTTLLGSLLGKFNNCITVPESQFKTEEYKKINNGNDLFNTFHTINNNYRFKIWDFDLEFEDIKHCKSFKEVILSIIMKYASVKDKKPEYWIDHTPENFKSINLLYKLFPNAKYIHLVRDGRAVANSIIPLDWGPNTIQKASRWWVNNVSYGLAVETFLEKDNIIRIKYEDVLLSPQKTVNEIYNFISSDKKEELPIIECDGFDKPKYTESQHKLVGKDIDKSRINAWQNKFTKRQVELFEFYSNDLLYLLGYNKVYFNPKSPNIIENIRYIVYELFKNNLINKIRKKIRAYKNIK